MLTSIKIPLYALWVMLIIYMGVLIKLLLFRTTFGDVNFYHAQLIGQLTISQNFSMANFIPFRGIGHVLEESNRPVFILSNILGNIAGFIPLGILVPLLFSVTWTYLRITLLGVIVSLSFEVIQLLAVRGCFDVDDIFLNTIGTIAGFAILSAILRFYHIKSI